jgi:pimeloyl-ACP methyl ester carboxylesterase
MTVAAALVLVWATLAFAQSAAGDLKLEPRVFESAGGVKVDAEFGQMTVPENRTKPGSRLIQLAFVRFKSTAAHPGPPIVYLSGGPGGPGIIAARGTRFPLFQAMREIADVIALDQRGTGESRPNLMCPNGLELDPAQPAGEEHILEAFRAQSRVCAETFRGQGIDLTGYNTNESADDLESLRVALGVPKLSLWAISYGTHLGLAMLKRHPQSVDRAILAGIEGPAHTVKLPSNIQKHLEHLDRMAKQDPELTRAIPSFIGLMRQVLARVDRTPVVVEITDPATKRSSKITVTKFILQLMTAAAFGTGEAELPEQYYRMAQGDFSYVARQWVGYMEFMTRRASAMSCMMDCSSGISPARKRQVAAEAKRTLLGDVMDFPFMGVCTAWGNPDLGESFRAPVRSTVPTLFISGTLDVRTPPSNAEGVRRGFTNSVHLIIDGAVHSDPLFLSSPKIKDVMLEFMRGEKVSTARISLEPLKFDRVSKTNSN